jgi:acyl carrier protein
MLTLASNQRNVKSSAEFAPGDYHHSRHASQDGWQVEPCLMTGPAAGTDPFSAMVVTGNSKEMSVEAKIRTFILDNFLFTNDESRLDNDVSFLEEGIVDSTGVLELVMFVEEGFGVAVEDEEIVPENFDSVSQLAHYVRQKANGK